MAPLKYALIGNNEASAACQGIVLRYLDIRDMIAWVHSPTSPTHC